MRLAPALVIALVAIADAAPVRTVRGVVTQAGGTRPIAGATVLTERGGVTVTDDDGYFTLDVTAADRELTIVADGYAAKTVALRDGLVRVELVAAAGGEIIEVTGKAPEETKPLSYALTADEIRYIPGAGNDILRAIQALPGVARIPYSFGGLVLRGMSPRDTSVWLDGVEVPIAFHFGGVTSFYPGGMLDEITLTSGGFDASYGRTQGGLVTLRTREPRTDKWRIGGSIGLLDSSIQIEGPLPKGGGMIAGLRRSYFDTIIAPFVEDDTPLPSYWDYQLRTSWGDPRKGGRIVPMIFGSIDRVGSSEVGLTSTFLRIAAPFHRVRGKTTVHVVPWIGLNLLRFEDKTAEQTFSRPVYPAGMRTELVRDVSWGHVRGGLELSGGYLAQTEVNVNGDAPNELQGNSTLAWTDAALWTEARFELDGERFTLKPGLRAELYGLTGELVVDPRLNISQQLTDTLTLREAVGRFHQPPTPGDIDPISGNPQLDSSYVDQLSLGVDAELPHETTASLTTFVSYGHDLGLRVRNPRPGGDLPEPNLGGLGATFELLLEKQLGFAIYRENLGRSRSAGAELLVKRSTRTWFTMLGYTLAISERTDDPRTFSVVRRRSPWRPFELDQRHNLQLAVSRLFTRWRFGARLQVVSGNPYSPTVVRSGDVVQEPWAGRLPTFISLDLRADRRWHRSWGDINLYIDIQNALNRDNVEGREFNFDTFRDQDIPGLPIIPFIGVDFTPAP